MNWLLRLPDDSRAIGLGRRCCALLVALQLLAAGFEFLGLVSFVPIFQYLTAGGDVDQLVAEHTHWHTLSHVTSIVGIPLSLGTLLLVTFALLSCRQVLTLGRTLYEHSTRERVTAKLRAQLFERFLWATAEHQDQATTGGIVADITQNSVQAALHIYGRLGLIVQLSICAVYLAGMITLHLAMTLLLLAVVGLSGLVAAPQLLSGRRMGKRIVAATRDVADFVIERMKLVRLVRISRMEAPEIATIGRLAREYGDANYGVWRSLAIVDNSLEAITMGVGLVVVYVAIQTLGLSIEIVGIFLAMLLRLVPVVRQIAKTKQATDATYAAFETVVRRLQTLDAARETSTGALKFIELGESIRFDKVSFTYSARPKAPVLRDVTLQIPAHKMTAIVGPSGAGKSTLIDLLPRLRTPDKGCLTLDGRNLAEFELSSLRRNIAYLSQTPLVFNVPLREHVAYGMPAATQTDIENAARLAGIHDTIMALPQGYATLAGEGGSQLSGGQRQRLDLARALLSRAPILILDEPAASLDGASAQQLSQTIERIRRETDTTIIIISHHLLSVHTADQIIVLRDGQVAAAGTHNHLIKTDGWYAATWRSQSVEQIPTPAPAA